MKVARHVCFAVGAGLALIVGASPSSAQQGPAPTAAAEIIDITVPYLLRDIHPLIMSVEPRCIVRVVTPGSSPSALAQGVLTPMTTEVSGNGRIDAMTKGKDGSLSGSFVVRLVVAVPEKARGQAGRYNCYLIAKTWTGISNEWSSEKLPGAQSQYFGLAADSRNSNRAEGQFTW